MLRDDTEPGEAVMIVINELLKGNPGRLVRVQSALVKGV